MTPQKNIVLIGYRGTGKSTVGKLLAAKLHRPFVDADVLLVQRAGKTIKQIFDEPGGGGEETFRDLESQIIAELSQKDGQVLALGGGAVLRRQNVAAFTTNSVVIWLRADAHELLKRIAADASSAVSRPNLTVTGGLPEIKKLLAHRTPLYQAAATITLDVTNLSPQQAADSLLSQLPPQILSDAPNLR
jgi:shikimate kinase